MKIEVLLRWLSLIMGLVAADFALALADDAPPPLLADAANRNDSAALLALLNQGADVHATLSDGTTALHWAAYHENARLVDALIAAGAKVDASNRYGVAPLSIACQNGNATIVEALLDAGADANTMLPGGELALMTAARTGRVGPILSLIAHGGDVDAKLQGGQTATMWAAAEGNVDAVRTLIDAGADFRTPLESGFTPLFFAARNGKANVVDCLLSIGLDVNDTMQPKRQAAGGPPAGTSALMLAVENGHIDLAIQLLEAGADANDDRIGYTPLHAITWLRKPTRGDGPPPPVGSGTATSLELVRALVSHGANVDAEHAKRRTNRDALNRTDATPLLLAAEAGDLPLVQLLVELGADACRTNIDRCTPLLAAAGVGVLSDGDESAGTEDDAIQTVEYLLQHKADINAVDKNGNSAMHGAAYKSWPKLVQVLADNGAEPKVWDRKNNRGWTPLLIAQGNRPGNFRPSAETEAAVRRLLTNGNRTANPL